VRIAGVLYQFPKEKVKSQLCRNRIEIFTNNNQANYEDAKAACEKQGMMLATLESEDEAQRVNDYLSYIGNKYCLNRPRT
jgi:hypothetical protein